MRYGDWVMYLDNLHKVSRHIGDRVYLYPDRFSFGWNDPRSMFANKGTHQFDEREMIVPLDKCTQISKEVADIMKGV